MNRLLLLLLAIVNFLFLSHFSSVIPLLYIIRIKKVTTLENCGIEMGQNEVFSTLTFVTSSFSFLISVFISNFSLVHHSHQENIHWKTVELK